MAAAMASPTIKPVIRPRRIANSLITSCRSRNGPDYSIGSLQLHRRRRAWLLLGVDPMVPPVTTKASAYCHLER